MIIVDTYRLPVSSLCLSILLLPDFKLFSFLLLCLYAYLMKVYTSVDGVLVIMGIIHLVVSVSTDTLTTRWKLPIMTNTPSTEV
jgi:hypothetical protein